MAKPINELLTELQKAVGVAEKAQEASAAAAAQYEARYNAAKIAFDAEVGSARKVSDDAAAKQVDAEAYVTTLQTEVNKILTAFSTSSNRVTISK
jgi:hypothetical protein